MFDVRNTPQAKAGQGTNLGVQRASYGGRVVVPQKTMKVPSKGRMKETVET